MFGVIFKSFKKFFKCLAKHLKKLLNVCQTFQIFFKCLKHFKSFSNVCRLLNENKYVRRTKVAGEPGQKSMTSRANATRQFNQQRLWREKRAYDTRIHLPR